MTVPTRVVEGHLVAPDGSDAVGTVTFKLNTPLHDSAGNVIVTRTSIKLPLVHGAFSEVLNCTSGGNIQPTSGVVYSVLEEIVGVSPRRYNISLPDTLGATIDLADLMPVDPPGLIWTVPFLGEIRDDGVVVGTNVTAIDFIGTVLGVEESAGVVRVTVTTDYDAGGASSVYLPAQVLSGGGA